MQKEKILVWCPTCSKLIQKEHFNSEPLYCSQIGHTFVKQGPKGSRTTLALASDMNLLKQQGYDGHGSLISKKKTAVKAWR